MGRRKWFKFKFRAWNRTERDFWKRISWWTVLAVGTGRVIDETVETRFRSIVLLWHRRGGACVSLEKKDPCTVELATGVVGTQQHGEPCSTRDQRIEVRWEMLKKTKRETCVRFTHWWFQSLWKFMPRTIDTVSKDLKKKKLKLTRKVFFPDSLIPIRGKGE
jgi:hypothetical protein